ncbi:MAG: hypothetical protein NTW03_12035 [Verrucomicrobia bacterium]|nr:hypothetical protein [Verrucomicrobiota bacterium]
MNNKSLFPSFISGLALAAVGILGCPQHGLGAAREVILFNGKDLSGWRQPGEWKVVQAIRLDAADPKKFTFEPGEGVFVFS